MAQLTADQQEYVRGRADWRAGSPDQALWLGSGAYRRGMADERKDQGDHEVLAWAEVQLAAGAATA